MATLRSLPPPPPTAPPPQKHRLSATTTHQAHPSIPSLLLNATTTSHVESFADGPTTELHWHYGDLGSHGSSFQVSARSFLVVIVAFSLLLLLALLFLYARWACWYRRLVITVSSSSVAHGSPPEPTGVLDREAIDGIPVVLHAGGDEAQCSICLGALEEGEKVKVLPACGHGFHPECVDEWLRAQPSCPLCRAVLEPSAGDGARVELAV